MTRLAIVLTEGFADWECAPLMGTSKGHLGIDCVVASPSGVDVTSMGGLRVKPSMAVEDLNPADLDGVVVCGGMIWETSAAPDLNSVLRSFTDAERLVAGICAGTLPMASAGLLNDVAHTSNARSFLETVPVYSGQDLYRDVACAVADTTVVTAPGTAPMTFMAEILRALGHGGVDLDAYLSALAAEHAQGRRI
jgi:putative intracellular protease/amidase